MGFPVKRVLHIYVLHVKIQIQVTTGLLIAENMKTYHFSNGDDPSTGNLLTAAQRPPVLKFICAAENETSNHKYSSTSHRSPIPEKHSKLTCDILSRPHSSSHPRVYFPPEADFQLLSLASTGDP